VESLKNAMARFLVDPSLVARMGRASRRMAESRYSVKKVNDHILSEISGTANR
jgi:glycosyltransferase involved in cell wall biosynthesis